jgi:ribosomal protein S18 acetylase RimI-like enzyme
MSESVEQVSDIKLFTPDDWEKFRDLRLKMVSDSPQAYGENTTMAAERSEQEWRQWLTSADQFYIEVDHMPVAAATFRYDDIITKEWVINGVWTDPEFRGRGYAKTLLQRIVREAKAKAVNQIYLYVRDIQTSAIELYESLGFVPVPEQDYDSVTGTGEEGHFLSYRLDVE